MAFRRLMLLGIMLLCMVSVNGFTGYKAEAAEQKIGVISINYILKSSLIGQEIRSRSEVAKSELEGKFKEATKAEKNALDALKKEVEEKADVWSDETKKKKMFEQAQIVNSLRAKTNEANRQLKKFEDRMLLPVSKKLKTILIAYCEKNGYDIILEKNAGVSFSTTKVDISDDLIKELDKFVDELKKELDAIKK